MCLSDLENNHLKVDFKRRKIRSHWLRTKNLRPRWFSKLGQTRALVMYAKRRNYRLILHLGKKCNCYLISICKDLVEKQKSWSLGGKNPDWTRKQKYILQDPRKITQRNRWDSEWREQPSKHQHLYLMINGIASKRLPGPGRLFWFKTARKAGYRLSGPLGKAWSLLLPQKWSLCGWEWPVGVQVLPPEQLHHRAPGHMSEWSGWASSSLPKYRESCATDLCHLFRKCQRAQNATLRQRSVSFFTFVNTQGAYLVLWFSC